MFVGKVDRDNTIKLIKMRMKENFFAKKVGIFLTIIFGMNLIALLENIFVYSDKVTSISSNVFSLWGFNIALLVCANSVFNFKDFYSKHQIYPQNKFSRFTSQEIYCYINFFLVQVYCLLMYLLEMAIVSITKTFSNNIELAYQFNLQYIIAGFIVTIMYGFLLIAILILYTTLLRKFKIPFGVLSVVITIFLLRSPYLSIVMRVLNFYIDEHSILLFLMKALGTWFLIVSLYHVINKYTKYYENEKFKFNKGYVTIIIAITVIIFVFLGSFAVFDNKTESFSKTIKISTGNEVSEINAKELNSDLDNYVYINKNVIDVSNIPEGSNITVQLPTEMLYKCNFLNTSILLGEEFTNPSDDKIIIEYTPSSKIIDYINLESFAKPELDVRLEDNKIYISEKHRKNVKVVMISPYSLMAQFDYFKGKQILKENIGNMQGSISGHIVIYQPEGKKLNFNIVYTKDKDK